MLPAHLLRSRQSRIPTAVPILPAAVDSPAQNPATGYVYIFSEPVKAGYTGRRRTCSAAGISSSTSSIPGMRASSLPWPSFVAAGGVSGSGSGSGSEDKCCSGVPGSLGSCAASLTAGLSVISDEKCREPGELGSCRGDAARSSASNSARRDEERVGESGLGGLSLGLVHPVAACMDAVGLDAAAAASSSRRFC